ncbi:MAG TPA: hypothetical protein VJ824_09310 [Bacillota bacterium]|nr:hypothetical protein [Bacillota bacterium]
MAKLIRTNFASAKEAQNAEQYLRSAGLSDVSVHETELSIVTHSDNWISAFEMIYSLGGTIENDAELTVELEEFYHIKEIGEAESVSNPEIEIIDDEAYIDTNLGYGDYELLEPYVLDKYKKMVNGQDKNA